MRKHNRRRPSRSGLTARFKDGVEKREQHLPSKDVGVETKAEFEVIQHRDSLKGQNRER